MLPSFQTFNFGYYFVFSCFKFKHIEYRGTLTQTIKFSPKRISCRNNYMKYKHFSVPFLNHFIQPSLPTIAKLKSYKLKYYKYDNHDERKYKVSPYWSPRPTWSPLTINCPTANFGQLLRGSITNSILITVFDTYLAPRSRRAWVWAKTLAP